MKRQVLRAVSVSIASSLALLTGCDGFFVKPGSSTGTSTTSGNVVYVANATAPTLAAFTVGSGTLTTVTGSPYSLGSAPTAVAVTPSNTFLYVGTSSVIYGYSIGTGGALTALNSGSGVAIAAVASMVVSPDGGWLLVLDANGLTIDEYQINTSTGALSTAAGATLPTTGVTATAHQIAISPSIGNNQNYVFLALGLAGDLVYQFNYSTGLLTSLQALAPIGTANSENALAVSPNGSYLYIARSGPNGGLAAYSIGTSGALTPLTGSPFAAGTQPYSVVVNKAGTDVYVANRTSGNISGYSIASGGTLTALTGSPYTSGSSVQALTLDQSGSYLLAASNGGSPDLTMYSFDSVTAGKLDISATSATGTDPVGPFAIAATH